MIVFDIETLSKKSNSVILSMAATYFDPVKKTSYNELLDNSFFAKFDVNDQMKRLNRVMDKSTLEWWSKQCLNVRIKSLKPSENDVKFEDGYAAMVDWYKKFNDEKCWIWIRGTLDQVILDDMLDQLGIEPIWHFTRYRDVRTAIDFMYGSTDGYCKVNYEGFDPFVDITKHDPVDDVVYDAMMMMYGIDKSE
jgi:3' exoribonuclease, RNase T-like